jgi:histidine triad (HIT) family protein
VKGDCIFCQIIAGEVPANILYRDEEVIVFPDIQPQAPKHLLVVPVAHINSVAELGAGDFQLMGKLILAVKQMAEREGIAHSGYRLIINSGLEAGQAVPHLHLHLLGGRRLNDQLG